jgi:GT2 family glycosyltransferase
MQKTLIPLIVTYNRKDKLKKTLNIWLDLPVKTIVVVDNSSGEDTYNLIRFLQKKNPNRIFYIKNRKNLGGAGGFHKGMKFIHQNFNYDWIVLQDDDAYPDINSIKYFLFKKKTKQDEAYMSAVYLPSGDISPMNIPGYNPFKNIKLIFKTFILGSKAFHINPVNFKGSQELEVDFASFVGFFISRHIIDKVGFPKAGFFIYADDIEYSLRIRDRGFKIKFDPSLKFYHDISSLVNNEKIYKPLWRAYFTYRNNLYIYKKLSKKFFPIVLIFKTLDWIAKTPKYEDKKLYLKLLFEAIKDGISGNFIKDPQKIISKYSK